MNYFVIAHGRDDYTFFAGSFPNQAAAEECAVNLALKGHKAWVAKSLLEFTQSYSRKEIA